MEGTERFYNVNLSYVKVGKQLIENQGFCRSKFKSRLLGVFGREKKSYF